ncbi:phenylalanine 4-monooxygenase [Luteibacter anthropi]|uniref:Phenylalanine-4-hydroxylase n=1 Tax=Luteibacter anthropi TaxID=564369 RepID=A0A7X5U6P0_9GAMM|nr:phenylalanine 4-monooxygenase [Luteibacter anthropi]NII04860.1 phenylalanine 4-monooxygenase [Luteibacter anthropi]URX63671.1 phenylalanine 4-monooxygenase [Luteibacter anthropi]
MDTTPRRVEHQQTDRGYVPVYATGTVEQPWASYSSTDHEVWDTLYRRQKALLPAYACKEFLEGVERFGFGEGGIPRFDDLNEVLGKATGWKIVAVEGLLPDEVFFDHLANRRFPVSWWIRKPDQLDYLSEPDLFHDLFGHVPLLLNPVFADYMQAYGKGGMKAHAIGPEALMNLTRLYWYTVEFGLIRTDEGLRIYGAGIVSSKGESIYSIDSTAPNRIGFDLERVMNTKYRIDTFQQTYFVIDDFEQLFDATGPDFTPIYAKLATGEATSAAEVLDTDKVYQRGTREGFATSGDN